MADRRQLPRLMGQQEIRERLGYSRQHTGVIIGQKGFPDPAYVLAMGRIWLAEDVEKWIREHRPELAEDPES
jgi:predicted DNA-binding transcriptional regulator AlpA